MEERAATDADFEALWALHVQTLGGYVGATWGWDEDDQRRRFSENWNPSRTRLLLERGAIAAAWQTEIRPDHVYLLSIEVAPAWQGHGLGSQLVLRVVSEAAALGKPTRLRVLKANPRAMRLYLRLGFSQFDEGPTHCELSTEAGLQAAR